MTARKTAAAAKKPTFPGRHNIYRQIEMLKVLELLLTEARKRELPAIDWRIGDLGSTVFGRVICPGEYNATLNAAFDAYATLIEGWAKRSIGRYGPGHASLPTGFKVWDRTGQYGAVHRYAGAEHVFIPTGRDGKIFVLNLGVVTDLAPPESDGPTCVSCGTVIPQDAPRYDAKAWGKECGPCHDAPATDAGKKASRNA